ncbi:endoglucanase E precursor [mine drainage metagenome]|uniref:Endoglucanase E n=1 Tax=mine drainage metagenome TaxID=410659 RepID=A0A1J5TSD8_9ZZZZ
MDLTLSRCRLPVEAMKSAHCTFLTLALGLLVSITPAAMRAADVGGLPVQVSANDTHLRFIGRFDHRDPAGPRCEWSGSELEVRFQGTALNVCLKEKGEDLYQVVVDGVPTTQLVTNEHQTVYRVVEGLADSPHVVGLFKRTEPLVGSTQFLGLQLPAGAKLLPPPPAPTRRIEFIGDSITCGYGNEGKDQSQHFSPQTENNYLAYGAVAARELNAEYVCVAWSGRTMWPTFTIPEIYDRTLPDDPTSRWDFGQWKPDVVLINLGTNDFREKVPDQAKWTAAYRAFLKRVRTNYPRAQIYCAIGPMMSDSYPVGMHALSTLRTFVTEMLAAEHKDGHLQEHFFEFAQQRQEDGLGADWHPSVKTDRIMADKLCAALRSDQGW